ncbi:hypothetical protein B0H10DRAFT_1941868 [Mycena sp. CBHHK59/15]|nr:hypothetical protein B0H10DRAFT_1941868 [Mycena sp. CBHHK59/15]
MTTLSLATTNASNPQGELETLVAQVAALTAMSLDMTQVCIDVQTQVPSIALSKRSMEITKMCLAVQTQIPLVVASQVAAATAAALGPAPTFVQGMPRTPDQVDAAHPPGTNDDQAWHVVCIGREPGLYASVAEADAQVSGVPNQFRQKKASRVEALAFYRLKYTDRKVEKWTQVPAAPTAAIPTSPVATTSTSAAPGAVARGSHPHHHYHTHVEVQIDWA